MRITGGHSVGCRLVAAMATVALCISAAAGVAWAQDQGLPAATFSLPGQSAPSAAPARTVSEIRVEGVQRIEPETVRSYMALRRGDPVDPLKLDQSLKNLFGTGLFADVKITTQGDIVVVNVVENPIINRIAFEGNRKLEDSALEAEVRLRPRVVYTRSRVQADVQRLLDIYRRSGRFAATVEPKVIRLDQNRVDLVFEINEGDPTEIKRISFVGNKQYSDSQLRSAVQTKETAWYRFLTSDDVYDPDRLTFDRELLRRFYLARGYADFRVVSAVAELTPDRSGFIITFTIEEGERYRFGKIGITSNLRRVEPTSLQDKVTVVAGEWYDADEVETTVNALTDAVGVQGYAFVDIRPRVDRDRDARTISVDFVIAEGPRVFVERINITGNLRTQDRVIRREVLLAEGDAFNTAKLRRSRQKLRDLGFFDKVEVTNVPGSTADRTVVDVDVRERSTGELSLGAGYSTSAGVLGDISIRERNLLGRGQDLRLGFQIGEQIRQIDLSFTEPYFLDRKIAAGFDLFNIERNYQRQSSFDKTEKGFALRAGYQLSDALSHSVRYTLREDTVSNVDPSASRFIKEQEGSSVTSGVTNTLLWDHRDSRLDPTEGYYVRGAFDFAGLGPGVRYVRPRLDSAVFVPLAPQVIASARAQGGYIFGLGEDVRITDRFFTGGSNLRGFALGGLGPRDVATDDALGGNWYYAGTLQVAFPLGLPSEFAISGRAFTDFGSSGQTDSQGASVVDVPSVRAAIGFGLTWRSPFGPVTMDFGFPILKEPFDETEIFHFTFGTAF